MSKVMAIACLILSCMVLTGCRYDAQKAYEKKKAEEDQVSVGNFRKVKYNGHEYILYKEYHGHTQTFSGLTHDPDCCF